MLTGSSFTRAIPWIGVGLMLASGAALPEAAFAQSADTAADPAPALQPEPSLGEQSDQGSGSPDQAAEPDNGNPQLSLPPSNQVEPLPGSELTLDERQTNI